MADAFNIALTFTLRAEGYVSNNPHDHGGLTDYGITQEAYNSYREDKGLPHQFVTHITMDEVREIYRSRYWNLAHCPQMPPRLATVHFDWAVNHGVDGAMKTLQSVLGVTADGIFGPNTQKALENMTATPTLTNYTIEHYLIARTTWYNEHGVGTQKRFRQGWLNRVNNLRNFLPSVPA